DVQFVEDAPERAEPDGLPALIACEKTIRDARVVQFGEVHRPCPRVGERGLLERQNVVNIGGCQRFYDQRAHEAIQVSFEEPFDDSNFSSLAISASGRRTYSGRTPDGSSASDARSTASRPIAPARSGAGATTLAGDSR